MADQDTSFQSVDRILLQTVRHNRRRSGCRHSRRLHRAEESQTTRACSSPSSRSSKGTLTRTPSSRGSAQSWRGCPALRCIFSPFRMCAWAAGQAQPNTSSRCSSDNLQDLVTYAPRMLKRAADYPHHRRRQQRSAEQRVAGQRAVRPRDRRALRYLATTARRNALRCLRPAPGLDHVHAAQPVPRRDGGRARILAESADVTRHLRARRRRLAGAARRGGALWPQHGSPVRESPGPVPRGHDLVQSETGVALGDAVTAITQAASDVGLPSTIQTKCSQERPRHTSSRWQTSRC